MSSGTPRGMIKARRQRDESRGDPSNLNHKVALGLDEVLRELEKRRISMVKVIAISKSLRAQIR